MEKKEEEAAKLRERKELAREGTQQLWKARGNHTRRSSKEQMYHGMRSWLRLARGS